MRILTVLTYYRPHTSGLTIYVERLARTLVKRGHEVTVLTSQFEKNLPREEIVDGVRIVRAPVLFRVSKGVIMPSFGFLAWKMALEHDVIHLHLPQFDAWGIALRGRLLGKPTTLTYHCDLLLPKGIFNRIVNQVVHIANHLAARYSDAVVAYTEDFAIHSPYLSRYLHKLHVITPPVEVDKPTQTQIDQFSSRYVKGKRPVIGIAARLATEKGVEYLLGAMGMILEAYPNAHVLFAGQHENVLGESEYRRRLQPLLDQYHEHWTFLGVLNPSEMATFYQACDVTVLPSVNSTESFGLVQIESMICGTPVIASNLPGVRQPVRMTTMGDVVPIRDSSALAKSILNVLDTPKSYAGNPQQIEHDFSPMITAEKYELLFQGLLENRKANKKS